MPQTNLVTIGNEAARATVAPELGGWLLRYARNLPDHGWVEALHCTQAIIDRYPREMYAGIPVLFPLVSRNHAAGKDHQYEWEGRIFEMPQHGFARRMPWSVFQQTPLSVTLELTDTEATRAVFPFQFRHCLTYSIVGGRLAWEQVIENRSPGALPFSTGFHPYFAVPLLPASRREDCFVDIPEAHRLTPHGNLDRFSNAPFPAQNWSVQKDVADTLYLGGLKRHELILVDPGANLEVVLNYEEAPQYRYAALWSKSVEAPFYCLEPWTALPNSFSHPREHGLLQLKPNQTFRAAMWIELRPMG